MQGYPKRRLWFRPPGLKPGTKIGRLGPFRGRLGVQWVVAAIVLSVLLAVLIGVVLVRGLPAI